MKKYGYIGKALLFIGLAAVLCFQKPAKADQLAKSKTMTINGTISIQDANHNQLHDFSDAIVYISEVNGNTGFNVKPESPVITSRNMTFVPPVLPILKGTTVIFNNNDDYVHNVYSLSAVKPFDLGISKKGEKRRITFDQPGLARIYCNIHKMMIGYLLILGNPYFTRVRQDATYSISDVPTGNYEVNCWYRYGETIRNRISSTNITLIHAGTNTVHEIELNFNLIKTHEDPLHNNKWGKAYKQKY